MLTVFMDFTGLIGGFFSEHMASHISLQLYIHRAFSTVSWVNFVAPTLKTSVFGFIIVVRAGGLAGFELRGFISTLVAGQS